MAKKPAMKAMQAAAKELNHVLKPEPPIKYVAVTAVEVRKSLKAAAALLAKGDKVSKITDHTLQELGIEHAATVVDVTAPDPELEEAVVEEEAEAAEAADDETPPAKKAKAKPKKKAKAKDKPKDEGVVLSRYGHREGTMLAAFDDLLWEGTSLDDAVKVAVDNFGRDPKSARGYFRGHIRNLMNATRMKGKSIIVTQDDDGIFKAEQESI